MGRGGVSVGAPRRRSARRAATLGALFGSVLLVGCTRWFFYPDSRLVATPADFGLAYRDVAIETRDGVSLHAWLIEPPGTVRGSVYFLHGNAENVSTHVRAALWLVEAGYRVLALDYRGYGRSGGEPDIPEVFEDVRAGGEWLFAYLDALAADEADGGVPIDRQAVHVFAQSLGAGLAIRHLELEPAQRARVTTLVVEAAFTRYGAIARHVARGNFLTRLFGPLAERALASEHDPLDAIGALAPLPVMIVHSPEDTIVPYDFGLALYRAAKAPKAFVEARGPHIVAVAEARVREAILAFMRRHESRGASGVDRNGAAPDGEGG